MKDQSVIIQCSARSDGDSSVVSSVFNMQFNTPIIDLKKLEIAAYEYHNENATDDFIPVITEMINNYNQWIFITPVYWYTMSGRMKIFLDRITDLLKWHKNLGRKMRGKSMALISISNDPELQVHFDVPVALSAEYLGMNYCGHQHVWVEEKEVNPEARKQLDVFIMENLAFQSH